MDPFATLEIGIPDENGNWITHKLTFTAKAHMERYINELTKKYIEVMHCGEDSGTDHLTCATCNAGAAHADEEKGEPGLIYVDKAWNSGYLIALGDIYDKNIKFKDYYKEHEAEIRDLMD